MNTYWNTAFTKRDYECTNIVAIKADNLPVGYDPEIWKANDYGLVGRQSKLTGLTMISAVRSNGERFELWGYL